jgi:predicted AlkP superfamily phosphohydrolase/phosphomutase/tetratricopeptide (TPR) repeat protein
VSPARKVLLVGWDAADWKVARPLLERGELPALQSLVEGGVWGRIATLQPVLSPMLWTSIATGKRADKHGIHGFIEPCPITGNIRPITNLSRRCKAIWNIFHQQGWHSQVIGWWPSSPAEPIRGVMVSNHYQQVVKNLGEQWPMRPGTVHPERLLEPLKEFRIHPAELQNEHILPFIPRAAEIDQETDPRMGNCARIIAESSSIHGAATALMQLEPWDFMAVYYDGIDHFGHGFMKYHPPRRPWIDEKDFSLYKDVVEAGYRYHDMMLGTLLRIAGEETTVMLLSDHGFEPGDLRPRYLPNEPAGPAAEHSPYGMVCLKGPGIKRNEQIHGASLLDITPTLLHLYGLPVGRDMDGKVLLNCFEQEQKVDSIDSWESVAGEDGRHPKSRQLDSTESREGLRQLIDLGYIEEPHPDKGKAIDETIRELQHNLAASYMGAGRYHEAAEILEKQWERWPERSYFGTKLLNCHLQRSDAVRGREILDRLVRRKEETSRLAQEKLEELARKRRERETEEKRRAETEGTPFVPAEMGKAERLEVRTLRGQAGTNQHAFAYYEGCVRLLEKDYAGALTALEQASGAETAKQPALHLKRAEVYMAMEDWDRAESAYREVLALSPETPEAHCGLARLYLAQSHPFQAAEAALASIELMYHNPQAHLLYGSALCQLNHPEMARQTLQTALQQCPQFPAAHRLLATVCRLLKDEKQAELHLTLAENCETDLRRQSEGKVEPAPTIREFPRIAPREDRLKEGTEPLIVVSGLPRSGTSLMMQMLKAAGLPLLTDEARCPDASNPRGYHEHERIRKLALERDCTWLCHHIGQAAKIVAPLLSLVPEELPLKIIFMERAIEEVLASQRKMLQREQRQGAVSSDDSLAHFYACQMEGINTLLAARPNWELLPVAFRDAVHEPESVARKVLWFLNHEANPRLLAQIAEPKLYRIRGGVGQD